MPVRQRRRWSTELIVVLSLELSRPEHHGRILTGYPRSRIDVRSEPAE